LHSLLLRHRISPKFHLPAVWGSTRTRIWFMFETIWTDSAQRLKNGDLHVWIKALPFSVWSNSLLPGKLLIPIIGSSAFNFIVWFRPFVWSHPCDPPVRQNLIKSSNSSGRTLKKPIATNLERELVFRRTVRRAHQKKAPLQGTSYPCVKTIDFRRDANRCEWRNYAHSVLGEHRLNTTPHHYINTVTYELAGTYVIAPPPQLWHRLCGG
jgi:hypothetical protein